MSSLLHKDVLPGVVGVCSWIGTQLITDKKMIENIKYLDLIREVLFSSSIKPGKMNRLRGKTI